MNRLAALFSRLLGRNTALTPTSVIQSQLLEKRPLPVGAHEFDEWADRIISGTLLPADEDSMKFALGTMILHLGPTESVKEDAYFIHSLRKSAVNQIADAKMREIRDRVKARLAQEEATLVAEVAAKQLSETAQPSEVTQDIKGTSTSGDVLVKQQVQSAAT